MIKILFSVISLVILLNVSEIYALSGLDTGGVRTILKKKAPKTPLQLMQESSKKSQNNETELPKSEFNYLPNQDSAFYKMLRLNLPVNVILQNNLLFSEDLWTLEKRIQSGTPWQVAIQNIKSIPSEFFNPSPVELVHRQILIENSLEVPFVSTYQRYGIKVTTETIASLLGLTEDVSPKISYTLDFNANIEVVVYSVSSVVVATLFSGKQTPGNYTLTWNGRDSFGRLLPPGDYIAEVRVGNEKYIRKRIVIR
jgi:hypothetical protein